MDTLYIIGNGFDTAHGIESSYRNFRDYLTTKCLDEVKNYRCPFCTPSKNSCQLSTILDSCENIGEGWNNFEKSLASFSPDVITQIAEEVNTSGTLYDKIEKVLEELFQCIQEAFESWINKVELSCLQVPFKLDKSAFYLTFNYTKTLEQIYGIPDSQIYHIHSYASDPSQVHHKYVIGHDCDKNEINEKAINIPIDYRYLFVDFLNAWKKDCVQQIQSLEFQRLLQNMKKVKKVVIIGHSLAHVDHPYFIELLNVNKTAEWIRCIHEDSETMRNEANELSPRISCVVSSDGLV